MLVFKKEEKQLFQISEDGSGELELYDSSSQPINKDSVYILLDNTLKKIFIWIGQSANVRLRFIASTTAQEMQTSKGTTYRVITIDQGGESKEFIKAISPITLPSIYDRII